MGLLIYWKFNTTQIWYRMWNIQKVKKYVATVGKQHHKDVRRNCGYTQILLAIFIVAIYTGCGI